MLALILLLQVSWLDPYEDYLDKQIKVINPKEVRLCVQFETRFYMETMQGVFEEEPQPIDKLKIFTDLLEKVNMARAACERAEILRRVTELETLVRQLIADRGR